MSTNYAFPNFTLPGTGAAGPGAMGYGGIGAYGLAPGPTAMAPMGAAPQMNMGAPVTPVATPSMVPGMVGSPVTAGMPTMSSRFETGVLPTTPGMDPTAAGTGGWMDSLMNGVKGTFWNEATPGVDGQPGMPGSLNLPAVGDLVKGIGAFGSLYMGFQQNKQAQESLDFQKQAYKTNLANQIGSYNMALEDRIRSRHAQTGKDSAATEAYINKHKMGA